MVEAKKKSIWKRWYMIVLYCFVGLMIIGAFLPDNSSDKTIYVCPDGSQVYDSSQCSSASAQTSTPAVVKESDKATMGEKNALSKALSYLDVMAFSYTGLIKQLEYEGYSHEEAKYGADNCGADWNEQAALKAQTYLDVMAFSRQGLIGQLIYEGFTQSQAEYGVNAVGY